MESFVASNLNFPKGKKLPESRLQICHIPVYQTNKMKNPVIGNNVD